MILNQRHYLTFMLFGAISLSLAQEQDLSLDDCVRQALEKNGAVLMADADVELSYSKSDEITAKLLPQLSAGADYRYYTDLPYQLMPAAVFGGPSGVYKEAQFGVPHVLNSSIQGTMPLYNHTLWSGRSTAKIGTELMEVQSRKTRESVVIDVSNMYFNAQIAANQIMYLQGNIKNLDQLIVTTTLLQQNNMARSTDIDKLNLQKSILNTQLTSVETNYRQLIGTLKYLIGLAQSDTLTIQTRISREVTGEPVEINSTTDILIARKMRELVESEIDGIVAGRYPSLAFYGLYGSNGYATTGDKAFQKFFPVSFIGVQLSIPIFDGGTISAKAEQKRLELHKTEIKEKLAIDKNVMDRMNTQNQIRSQRKTIAMQEENVLLAEKLYEQTMRQFSEGIVGIVDVLQAESAVRDAQTNYLTALVKMKMIDLEWKYATGNLLERKKQ